MFKHTSDKSLKLTIHFLTKKNYKLPIPKNNYLNTTTIHINNKLIHLKNSNK
jgi:hypothetical protein